MIEDIFNIEEQQKKLTDEQKRIRQKEINDLFKILKTPEGRRWCWRMLDKCGVFRNSFSANSNATAFAEGTRDVGLGLLRDINEADISAFAQMQNEYLSALNSKKQAKEAQDGRQ